MERRHIDGEYKECVNFKESVTEYARYLWSEKIEGRKKKGEANGLNEEIKGLMLKKELWAEISVHRR